jgi:hypothetical protein
MRKSFMKNKSLHQTIVESLNKDIWYEPGYTPPQPPPPPVQYNDDDYTPGLGSDVFPPVTWDVDGKLQRWYYGSGRWWRDYINNPFRPPPVYKIPRRPGFDPNWLQVRGLPRYGPAIYPWDPSRPP